MVDDFWDFSLFFIHLTFSMSVKFLLFTLVKDIEISCIIKWKISLSSIFNKKSLKIPKG